MDTIKFGTDGWRAIIADTFTVNNVNRVAWATAKWLQSEPLEKHCVLGYDCRFGGQLFAEETACVLASEGIKVSLSPSFVSTPMISLAAFKMKAGAGIILTASHNPPSYNGFKIKAHYGGPASPAEVSKIEDLIPDSAVLVPHSLQAYLDQGMVEYVDFESMYIEHCQYQFDMDLLQKNAPQLAYDAMYGAGQAAVRKMLPKTQFLHADYNPSFMGRAPEPIAKNLPELSDLIANTPELTCGLATDGDADRIGFFDEHGTFVDSHHLILLLIEYLTDYKGYTGKVVKSFSVSDKVQALADLKGLETITTKIGFKYICEHMVEDDVLIGAEESGGIAIKGHIPERDGVWMGLVLMEYCAKTGKTVSQLIQDVYAKVGSFAVERYDLHINNDLKLSIIENCKSNHYDSFGDYKITQMEDTDGFKFRLNTGAWVMIRPSGTEPVLRVYSEAATSEEAFRILDATQAAILN
ncbi:MAG: phosphoglucomutase/phosphomannomutase family protein [Bacteroidetes bacterium]|nr:phosphoglucomutase/phosphomannomutase family protein [Bacteroidota bacterium]